MFVTFRGRSTRSRSFFVARDVVHRAQSRFRALQQPSDRDSGSSVPQVLKVEAAANRTPKCRHACGGATSLTASMRVRAGTHRWRCATPSSPAPRRRAPPR